MESLIVDDRGIPKARYTRIGAFSRLSRPPLINKAELVVTIFFPLSPRLAYLIGAVYGDGSVSFRRLTYFNTDENWLVEVAQELTRLTVSGRPRPQFFPPEHRGCYSVDYCNAALARLIRGLTKIQLETVSNLTENKATLVAFLAGIFDSEGSASVYFNESHRHGSPEIAIANSNLGMLRILQRRLQRFGLVGGISLSREPMEGVIDNRPLRGKKRVYRLRFSGWSSSMRFARIMVRQTKSRKKRARLE